MEKELTITVITKLNTPNAGNQALSTELLKLLKRTYPDAMIYAGWQERGLDRYSLFTLERGGSDPLSTIDGWATRIVNQYNIFKNNTLIRAEKQVSALKNYELSPKQNDVENIVRLNYLPPSLLVRIYNKGLRSVKKMLDSRKVYGNDYSNWLTVLSCSDMVFYSPAGAMLDITADDVVRDFLGLRIAQKMGANIMAVNQSIEVKHSLLLRLLGQLYSEFDAVIVRDPISFKRLSEIQVPIEKIKLAPDTAYLAKLTPLDEQQRNDIITNENIKSNTVGITLLPRANKSNYSDWGRVIEMLRSQGKDVIFISHEMATDSHAGKALQQQYGVRNLTHQYDYGQYIQILSLLESVISERYHTCVFSTIAGTPFIPLNNWTLSKMQGIIWALDYPILPQDTFRENWVDHTQEKINYLYQNYDQLKFALCDAIPRLRKMAEMNIPHNFLR